MENNHQFLNDFGTLLNNNLDEYSSSSPQVARDTTATLSLQVDGDSSATVLGHYVRAARRHRNLTPEQFAHQLQQNEAYIYAIEHGIIPADKIEDVFLEKLANLLDEQPTFFALLLERSYPKPQSVADRLQKFWASLQKRVQIVWSQLRETFIRAFQFRPLHLAPSSLTTIVICLLLFSGSIVPHSTANPSSNMDSIQPVEPSNELSVSSNETDERISFDGWISYSATETQLFKRSDIITLELSDETDAWYSSSHSSEEVDVAAQVVDIASLPPENSLRPAEIGSLTHLTDLRLSTNSLSALPAEIGNLNSQTDLQRFINSLSALPAEIGNLNSLTLRGTSRPISCAEIQLELIPGNIKPTLDCGGLRTTYFIKESERSEQSSKIRENIF